MPQNLPHREHFDPLVPQSIPEGGVLRDARLDVHEPLVKRRRGVKGAHGLLQSRLAHHHHLGLVVLVNLARIVHIADVEQLSRLGVGHGRSVHLDLLRSRESPSRMDSRGRRPRDLVVSSKRTNGSARLFDGTHNLLGFWGWETSHASVSLRFTFDTSATCATSRALALRALVLKLSFPLGAAEEPILPLFPCP